MEALDISHCVQYRILLCSLHGQMIFPASACLHLRRTHSAKNPLLRAAMEEIQALEPSLLPSGQIPSFPDQQPVLPIAGLAIRHGFQCALTACNGASDSLSHNRRTVEKHQLKVHAVGHRRQAYVEPSATSIRAVCIQSFFPLSSSHYRPFLVTPHADISDIAATGSPRSCTLHADNSSYEDDDEENNNAGSSSSSIAASSPLPSTVVSKLDCIYQRSQQQWYKRFDIFPTDCTQASIEIAPWIRTTGIFGFFNELAFDKSTLRTLIDSDPQETGPLLEQCVYHALHAVREQTFPGNKHGAINRVTARILNSFEPGRTQSRPFVGVQELTTLQRYAKAWSRCLFLLHRVSIEPEFRSLRARIASMQPRIKKALAHFNKASRLFRSANIDCLEFGLSLPSSRDPDISLSPLQLHAIALQEAVCELSVALVCQDTFQEPFSSGVVVYCALCALRDDGSWIPAASYGPFLSGMIHCMQLWLFKACLDEKKQREEKGEKPVSLEILIRHLCERSLINTSASPVAELSFWRLLSRSASNDSVIYPVTTVSPDCTQVNHCHIELRVQDWQVMLRRCLVTATEILENQLLFALNEYPRYPARILHDHSGDSTPGKSFLDDPRNQLHAVKDWLFHQWSRHPRLTTAFLLQRPDQETVFRPSRVQSYLHANQRFLRYLAILIYMGSGLPPRRKEITGLTWCNQETARNIYIHHGLVVFVTGYHKMQWRVGTRPVARFLPPEVGDLLVTYLIYVGPFLRFLHESLDRPTARGYLFYTEDGDIWSADQLSASIKRLTTLLLGTAVSLRQWRHIAIALDRAVLQGFGCRTLGISAQWGQRKLHAADGSGSESEYDHIDTDNPHGQAAIHDFQASHTPGVANRVYGNDISMHQGMTDSLLHAYLAVSQAWQRQLAQLDAVPTARSLSPHRSAAEERLVASDVVAGSNLQVRCRIWTWPALQQGLQRLFGPQARPRTQSQRDGLVLIARSRPEAIVVMPTGSGKTLLYVVPTLLPEAQVTVIIVPLIALKQDLLRRCTQWNLAPLCYQNSIAIDQLHAVPSLVLVDIETAVTPSFLAFLQQLQAHGRLDRIVLDEAHLVLTAAHYRTSLGLLGDLRRIHCPFIAVTATLPPVAQADFQSSLFFTAPEIVRASSDRANLQYCVQTVAVTDISINISLSRTGAGQDTVLLDRANAVCMEDIRQWKAVCTEALSPARGICFVRQKQLGLALAERLGCGFYHGGLDDIQRRQITTAWSQGSGSPFIVATSAFGAGIDYPSIRRIIHLGPAFGLLDYAQETGRAGRDNLPAVCLILLPENWTIAWDSGYQSNFLEEDRLQMSRFLTSRRCLRKQLTAYLDGPPGTACSDDDRGLQPRLPCGNCQQSPRPHEDIHIESSILGEKAERVGSKTVSLAVRTVSNTDVPFSFNQTDCMERTTIDHSNHSRDLSSIIDDSNLSPAIDEAVYDVAAQLARSAAMDIEEARQCYEARLVKWGRACIPCSFARRQLVEGLHENCTQSSHASSLQRLRRGIRFAPYSACYSCGQPGFVCSRRGQSGCMQPWLLWHSCWTALWLDRACGPGLIALLGGPSLQNVDTEQSCYLYFAWLGRKALLFRQEASNAARLLHQWLDRLEALCSMQS